VLVTSFGRSIGGVNAGVIDIVRDDPQRIDDLKAGQRYMPDWARR